MEASVHPAFPNIRQCLQKKAKDRHVVFCRFRYMWPLSAGEIFRTPLRPVENMGWTPADIGPGEAGDSVNAQGGSASMPLKGAHGRRMCTSVMRWPLILTVVC
ncbi:hypothetical protein, unlikely [Trypanosoma brucei gambiense DAL972]|uniref:Uncharacterized protein n=1 Tax=Trypanosoma brucei gambiense (strain MHOM/CI/86/DAL972) TaxID=679716 RepID=D0A0Y1_TRYB9|nr:hypothetical protein, unlikely [Trypanosoma brucei gambiense DAL972]CBH14923.1 hypothetical protein, unlikely [Trypanosoma brucei gambiense DAL972]|eukprot:XP_011777189.1 hypothetical protein, unlikely [Trypanosoma brucei gambiense DAL972]